MRDSSELVDRPAELRRRFLGEGYILIRGLLPPEVVLELRRDYFSRFPPGFLAEGSDPADGVFSGTTPAGLPAYGTTGHPAYDMVRGSRFDELTRREELRRISEALLDGPTELLPRRILRHFSRDSQLASRAHTDHDYIDRGTEQLVTAWIPLGDCPLETGGLVYLERSHDLPRERLDQLRAFTDRPGDRRPLSNDLALTSRTLGRRWLWTDFRAGDVALHSPNLVHASLDNHTDRMRLSADLRFRRSDGAPDERWLADWSADDGY